MIISQLLLEAQEVPQHLFAPLPPFCLPSPTSPPPLPFTASTSASYIINISGMCHAVSSSHTFDSVWNTYLPTLLCLEKPTHPSGLCYTVTPSANPSFIFLWHSHIHPIIRSRVHLDVIRMGGLVLRLIAQGENHMTHILHHRSYLITSTDLFT